MTRSSAALAFPKSPDFLSFVKDTDNADHIFYQESRELCHEIGLDVASDSPFETLLAVPPPKPAAPKRKTKNKDASSDVSFYYRQLAKFPPFSREEEVATFKSYLELKRRLKKSKQKSLTSAATKALEKDVIGLRNHIVERNLKFVVKLARTFWMDNNLENFENLVSAGNIGLIRAVDRFDLAKGVRFLTYAANWIALEIRIELSGLPLIHVPIWWQKTLKKLSRAFNELAKDKEHVSIKLLADRAKVPVRHLQKLSVNGLTLRLEQIPSLKIDVPYCEITHHSASAFLSPSPEEICIQVNARDCLHTALYKLKGKERRVIESVFGLGDKAPKNLRQVSNIMGNTGERVRQLREKGIDLLRKKISAPKELGGLGVDSLRDLL